MTSVSRRPSPVDRFRRGPAKRLRQRRTEPELRLWGALRDLPLIGSHFRQQVPIGPYVADFACMASHLVIEIDGSQHGDEETSAHEERSRRLESEGYRVLRFWNSDLHQNLNGVLETVYAAVHGSLDAETTKLKHRRHERGSAEQATPPRRARRADPPPPGEGGQNHA